MGKTDAIEPFLYGDGGRSGRVDGTAKNGWRISDGTEGSATQYLTQFRIREDTAAPSEQPKLDVTFTPP